MIVGRSDWGGLKNFLEEGEQNPRVWGGVGENTIQISWPPSAAIFFAFWSSNSKTWPPLETLTKFELALPSSALEINIVRIKETVSYLLFIEV